jgi:hypothetical protein
VVAPIECPQSDRPQLARTLQHLLPSRRSVRRKPVCVARADAWAGLASLLRGPYGRVRSNKQATPRTASLNTLRSFLIEGASSDVPPFFKGIKAQTIVRSCENWGASERS